MLTVNPNTKKGEMLISTAMRIEGFHLYDIYNRYSHRKLQAFTYCREMYIKEGGNCFHICSHNTNTFTVAWFVKDGVRIETAYNSYFIPMKNAIDAYLK